MNNFDNILNLFGLPKALEITELKKGHSNHTYDVKGSGGRYILQSLNKNIFEFPQRIMNNISSIERAFEKYPESGIEIPHYIYINGRNYTEYNNEVWRIYEYIEDCADGTKNFFEQGLTIGTFLRIVNSADIRFEDCMPQLHNFNIDGLPKRNIHGDTKSDNIIFGKKTAIIDFDTTMVNHVCVDYGDMIRSITTDSFDLKRIYEATKGFANGVNGLLTYDEIKSLYLGIVLIIKELAKRYHEGVKNFPNKTPEQCLEREKKLILQLDEFYRHENEIISIINNCFGYKDKEQE